MTPTHKPTLADNRQTRNVAFIILALLGTLVLAIVAVILGTGLKTEAALATANEARTQSMHNSAIFYAVCQQFHKVEALTAQTADANAQELHEIDAVERQYPRPNNNPIDIAYHVARRRVLQSGTKRSVEIETKARTLATFDCNSAMGRAFQDAPTPVPDTTGF